MKTLDAIKGEGGRHNWRWDDGSHGYLYGNRYEKRTCLNCGMVLSITSHAKVGACITPDITVGDAIKKEMG